MDPNQPVPEPIQPEIPTQPTVPIIEQTMQPVIPQNPNIQQPNIDSFQPPQTAVDPIKPMFEAQPVEQSELTGATTQQQFAQPIDNVSVPQPKKSKTKLFIIIGVVLAACVGLGTAAWLLLFNNMSLKQYSNDDYSILVPESYKETEYGSNADFKKPDTKSGYESEISITVTPLVDDYRDEYVKELDKIFNKESLSSGGSNSIAGFSQSATDIVVKKSTKDGMDIRTASAKILDDKVLAGRVKLVIIISDKNAYTIAIRAHSTEPKLYDSADRIIESFKEK